MKRLLVLGAGVALAAAVALSGCSSSAPAPQPTTKPAASQPAASQPTAQSSSAPAAQTGAKFPTKGIEIIVGFDPGSGSDSTTRAFVPFLQKALGQTITVLNQPGAGGAIGWSNSAKAKPDGYQIGYLAMPSMQMAAVQSKVEYDPLTSYAWLGMIAYDPAAMTVKGDGPFKTVDDLVAAAKKDPGKVTIGATGKASNDYTTGISIGKSKGVKFTVVNFDGTPAGVTAVLGGNLSAMGMNASTTVPYVKSGQLRTIAVGGEKRYEGLPDVPTFKETGVDLMIPGIYRGFIGPKDLPADVKATLAGAIKTASEDPGWKAQAEKMSLPLMYVSPEETAPLAAKLNESAKEAMAQ